MNKKIFTYFICLVSVINTAYGDEFDDPISIQVPGENAIELDHKNEIDSVTLVPENENSTNTDLESELLTETADSVTEAPDVLDENEMEPQTEEVSWHINQYMPGCDHEVRDCFDTAMQLNNPEGHDKDSILFDCMEAYECMPLKRWACDSNLNFVNRHVLLTEKCLKWGLYKYAEEQEQEEHTEAEAEQEVDREL